MMRQNTNKIKQDDISYYDCLKKRAITSRRKMLYKAHIAKLKKNMAWTMGMC